MKLHDHQYRCKKCQMLHPSEMDRFFKHQQFSSVFDDPESYEYQNMVAMMYSLAEVILCSLKIDFTLKSG